MCRAEIQYHFCPCRNPDCKAPSTTCPKQRPPPKNLTQGRLGHYVPTGGLEVDSCFDWEMERLSPGASLVAPKCPKLAEGAALVIGSLCSKCQHECADKQTGPAGPRN
ncbi:hypothetical protein TgHK011_005382 [Trichoderma gracile]|nr:hypothetical protein TgHK011_005382 [Trichoderma gracile]